MLLETDDMVLTIDKEKVGLAPLGRGVLIETI
jgi:hypothetical protein